MTTTAPQPTDEDRQVKTVAASEVAEGDFVQVAPDTWSDGYVVNISFETATGNLTFHLSTYTPVQMGGRTMYRPNTIGPYPPGSQVTVSHAEPTYAAPPLAQGLSTAAPAE